MPCVLGLPSTAAYIRPPLTCRAGIPATASAGIVTDESAPTGLFALDPGVATALRERIVRARRTRPGDQARRALDALETAARGRANLMPPIIEAVERQATLGEICDRLRAVFGTHQPSVTF